MTSRAWYFVAALIGIAGIAGAVLVLIARLGGMTEGLTQIVVPGGADLDLKQAGTYTIYHESTSTVGGRVYQSNGISGLRVVVRSADSGQPIVAWIDQSVRGAAADPVRRSEWKGGDVPASRIVR